MNRSSMIFLLLLFSAAIFFSSPWLSGDGRKYFFLARSVVIDRDINLYNEFGYFFQGVQGAPRWGRELDSGYSLILHPVGASLFFIPFLFVGHLLSQFLKILGIPIIANGFSYPETALPLLASAFAGLLGVFLLMKTMRKFFTPGASLFSSVLTLFTTSLTAYFFIEPSYSHSVSFFSVSLFLYAYFFYPENRKPAERLIVLIILLSFSSIIRQTNVLYGVFLIKDFIDLYREKGRRGLLSFAGTAAISCVMFLIVISPQLLVYRITTGNLFSNPYVPIFRFSLADSIASLFSSRHGLFHFHPVLFLGLAGIFVFIRKSARIPLSFLAAFLFFALFAGSLYFFPAWDFGGRKYIEILPMFSFGFAALYDALGGNKRFPIKIVAASLLVSAVLWNILLLILYYPMDAFDRNGYIPYYEILHRFLILIEKAVNFPYVFAAIAAVVIAITLAVVFQKRNFTVPDMDFPVPGARFAALIAAASIAFSVFFIASDSLSSLYKTIVPGPEVGFRAVPVKLKDPDDFAGTGISKRVDGEVVVELTGPLDSGDEMRLAFRTVNPDALDGIGIEFFDGAGKEVFKTSMRKENASIFPDYCNGGLNGQHRLFLPFPARISGLLNSFSLEKEKREAGCNPCFAVFRLNPEERFSFERLRIKASSGNISFEGLLFL